MLKAFFAKPAERARDAIMKGDLTAFKKLLDGKKIELNGRMQGYTWLHWAVAKQQLEILKFLADQGADVNLASESPQKSSPLTTAAQLPDGAEYLQILMSKGADANYQDGAGETALNFAIVKRLWGDATMRLVQLTNPNLANRIRETPLHIAAVKLPEAVPALIQAGANVNAIGPSRRTPLHEAASIGSGRVIRYLLEAGADKELETTGGRTAFDLLPRTAGSELKKLLRPTSEPEESGTPYKGYTKNDADLFNQMFEEPNEWSCCPVCLAYVRRSDGCMYMRHRCNEEERHEELFEMFEGGGFISWCTICGRIAQDHQHFRLSLVTDDIPEFETVQPGTPTDLARLDSDCRRDGGGGFKEKVKRTHRLLGYACELQTEVGKISEKQARRRLIEEVWNSASVRNPRVSAMIANKTFEFPCTFPEDTKPVAEEAKVYPDIPRPADQKELTPVKHEAPDNDCVVELGPHDDGRPTYEFRHKQADGTIVNHAHVCAPDLEATIRAQPIDGTCRIEPDKCKALLYPEELKDIATPEFYEVYRKQFNKSNAKQGGGAGGLMRPLDMDTATCAPPQKAARRRRKTRRNRKGRRKTRKV